MVIVIVGVTCNDGPCQNGGVCEPCDIAVPQCVGFVCRCKPPFAGSLCDQYKRCFETTRRCYLSADKQNTFEYATEHCTKLRLSKPAILNADMERTFRTYLRKDPRGLLQKDYVWLGAQSQPISRGYIDWKWIDDVPISKHSHTHFPR